MQNMGTKGNITIITGKSKVVKGKGDLKAPRHIARGVRRQSASSSKAMCQNSTYIYYRYRT